MSTSCCVKGKENIPAEGKMELMKQDMTVHDTSIASTKNHERCHDHNSEPGCSRSDLGTIIATHPPQLGTAVVDAMAKYRLPNIYQAFRPWRSKGKCIDISSLFPC